MLLIVLKIYYIRKSTDNQKKKKIHHGRVTISDSKNATVSMPLDE
jgi:hypothetical protein